MIDVAADIQRVVFNGDFDEQVTITREDGSVVMTFTGLDGQSYPLTGVFTWQDSGKDVNNVTISDMRKLTLSIPAVSLLVPCQTTDITIAKSDILTIRGTEYGVLSATDNLHGLIVIELGEQ